MSSPDKPLSAEAVNSRVRERLNALRSAGAEEVSPRRWTFREAAALLSSFDATELRPVDPSYTGADALVSLIDDSEAVGDPTRGRWRLKSEVRKTTLRRLDGADAALRAFSANREEGADEVERTVRAYLVGEARPLAEQNLEQLAGTIQAVRWLREIRGLRGIPAVEEIREVQRRKHLYDPLESLVGDSFHGRQRELDRLRLHIGVLDPDGLQTKIRSRGRKLNPFSGGERSPMMVHGPPGIGKSTLLAKLALEHSASEDARIPFVFVDFERPTLSVLEPSTLLAEAARQLGVQYPAIAGALAEVEQAAAREAKRQRQAVLDIAELEDVSTARATVHREASQRLREEAAATDRDLIGSLVEVLAEEPAIGPAHDDPPPLLFVLDSFEQAQYRSSPYLRRLWEAFKAFQNAYPPVRVVVSGRAPVEELEINREPAEYLEVKEFDVAAATAFLIDEGVTDPDAAAELARRFGGNPLSLKLTARLAIRERLTTEWASDVSTRHWFLRRRSEDQIQSRLYLRLLKSLHDPDVAALAHPGLVLRRITPEIIKEVLAEPCGVAVPDSERAEQLFDEFARQVDLVQREGPRELSHRPDLRRDMLQLVVEDKPVDTERAERRAVAYYQAQQGPAARAEEIYHRLRLGEAPQSVDPAWEPGVEDYLRGAQAEVPTKAHAYLAAKLADARVPPEVLADADFRDWETLTAREVDDLLGQAGDDERRRRNAKQALELMHAREGWSPGSPLFALKAEALEIVGDEKTAQEAVEAGISAIDDEPGARTASVSTTLLDLLLLAAKLYQDHGEAQRADRRLQEAEGLAARLGRGLDVVSTLLYRVRLHAEPSGDTREQPVRERAAREFLELDEAELREQPALVHSIGVELGPENADVLARAIAVLGVHVGTADDREALVRHIDALVAGDRKFAEWLKRFAGEHGVRLHDGKDGVALLVDRLQSTGRLAGLATVLVARSQDGSDLRRLLVALLPESTADALLGGNLGPALS